MNFLHIDSEIEPLQAVLLHHPGRELEELTPRFLEELLFDDIPWLERIQEEHELFAQTLEQQGTRVYYYHQLLQDILKNDQNRQNLLSDYMQLNHIRGKNEQQRLQDFLAPMNPEELSDILIGGLHKKRVALAQKRPSLATMIEGEFNYYFPPLPNLYFTRDPGAVIGSGISVNSMRTPARKGESLLLHHIVENHPLLEQPPQWFGHNRSQSLEGGDILILSPKVVLIGCSARSSSSAIEELAQELLQEMEQLEKILVIQIPFERAYMHLDTVFTMVDYDSFILFPGIERHISCFSLSLKGKYLKVEAQDNLEEMLKRALKLPQIRLLRSGGDSETSAAREQWNDSTNTLAVAPGKVVTYNRNQRSNETLQKEGIQVIPVEGSELVRGRGGPRCMSMPLRRKAWSGN